MLSWKRDWQHVLICYHRKKTYIACAVMAKIVFLFLSQNNVMISCGAHTPLCMCMCNYYISSVKSSNIILTYINKYIFFLDFFIMKYFSTSTSFFSQYIIIVTAPCLINFTLGIKMCFSVISSLTFSFSPMQSHETCQNLQFLFSKILFLGYS